MARQKRKAATAAEPKSTTTKTRKLEAVVIKPEVTFSAKPEAKKTKKQKQQSEPEPEPAVAPAPTPAPARPLSALAARRAAIESGLYKAPEEEEEEEVKPDSESEPELEYNEGQEVMSFTDEEEMGEEGEDEEDARIVTSDTESNAYSRGVTPTSIDASSFNEQQVPKKRRVKNPLYLDPQAVSNFTPTEHNSCIIEQEGEHYLFLGLKKGENILFLGQVLAAPLYGSISVMGAVLSSGREVPTNEEEEEEEDLPVHFYPVYSSRTHSLLRISSEPLTTPSIKNLHGEPEQMDFNLIEAVHDELKQDMSQFETILVIKDNSHSGLQDMHIHFSSFKHIFKFRSTEYKKKIENSEMAINMVPSFTPLLFEPVAGVRPFHIESSWNVRTDFVLKNNKDKGGVSIVCGAKDTGKSSFTKYYINRLLSKYESVAYIETDLGQPEFSPAGLLSLHYIRQPILGPSFTHQHLEPERSFFFGSSHPKDDPDYYLACISELMDHADKNIPLVVNTQGWVSGLGYDLLLDQIQKAQPTDIFVMRHALLDYKNLPSSFNVDVVNATNNNRSDFHYLDCAMQINETTLSGNFTAADHREMTLGSYFNNKRRQNTTSIFPRWDYHKHMMDRIPWSIDWRVGLNSIWVIYEEVKLSQLFYALNGSMVGLVGDVVNFKKLKGPNHSIPESDNHKFIPPNYFNTQDQPLPLPSTTTCFGLGIVRAIDPSRHALLLLTPVPKTSLEYVSSLVKGELQLPLWTMFDYKNNSKSTTSTASAPYLSLELTEGAGANALKVRRNLLRKV